MSTKKWFLFLLIIFSFIIPSVSATRPHYIYDYANVVSPEYENYINQYGWSLDNATTAEVVAVTISDLPSGKTVDETKLYYLNDASLDGVKGVGKAGRDNGVVILLVMNSHDWAIETGYGVESQLTDAMCGVIGRDVMTPQFKKGDFGVGLYYGMKAVGVKLGYDVSVTMTNVTVDTTVPETDPNQMFTMFAESTMSIALFFIPVFVISLIIKNYIDAKSRARRTAELIERSRIEDEKRRKYLEEQERKQEERRLADEERRKTSFFCPHCNKQTIGRMQDEKSSEYINNDFIWLLTVGSVLCLTCRNSTDTSENRKQLESISDRRDRLAKEEAMRKEQERREAEERRQREEEEQAERIRRRKREAEYESRRRDDSYSSRSSSSDHDSGSSFGGGHSGGGGASGKWG